MVVVAEVLCMPVWQWPAAGRVGPHRRGVDGDEVGVLCLWWLCKGEGEGVAGTEGDGDTQNTRGRGRGAEMGTVVCMGEET